MRSTAVLAWFALGIAACGSSSEADLFSGSSSGGTPSPAAGPFTCGTRTCSAGQLCVIQGGRASCESLPDACRSAPTCDCVDARLSCRTTYTCSETNGEITWQCQ